MAGGGWVKKMCELVFEVSGGRLRIVRATDRSHHDHTSCTGLEYRYQRLRINASNADGGNPYV